MSGSYEKFQEYVVKEKHREELYAAVRSGNGAGAAGLWRYFWLATAVALIVSGLVLVRNKKAGDITSRVRQALNLKPAADLSQGKAAAQATSASEAGEPSKVEAATTAPSQSQTPEETLLPNLKRPDTEGISTGEREPETNPFHEANSAPSQPAPGKAGDR